MQIAKNKTAAIAIALFLMISMGAAMMVVPNVNAHTPAWNIPTFAYIAVAPNPVGVGQPVAIFIWVNQIYDRAAVTNNYRFHNFELTITAPNGQRQNRLWDTIQDPTSNQLTHYTPTQVGTYTLNFTFPGETINAYPHHPWYQ